MVGHLKTPVPCPSTSRVQIRIFFSLWKGTLCQGRETQVEERKFDVGWISIKNSIILCNADSFRASSRDRHFLSSTVDRDYQVWERGYSLRTLWVETCERNRQVPLLYLWINPLNKLLFPSICLFSVCVFRVTKPVFCVVDFSLRHPMDRSNIRPETIDVRCGLWVRTYQ